MTHDQVETYFTNVKSIAQQNREMKREKNAEFFEKCAKYCQKSGKANRISINAINELSLIIFRAPV